jgi:hypothetical protein
LENIKNGASGIFSGAESGASDLYNRIKSDVSGSPKTSPEPIPKTSPRSPTTESIPKILTPTRSPVHPSSLSSSLSSPEPSSPTLSSIRDADYNYEKTQSTGHSVEIKNPEALATELSNTYTSINNVSDAFRKAADQFSLMALAVKTLADDIPQKGGTRRRKKTKRKRVKRTRRSI